MHNSLDNEKLNLLKLLTYARLFYKVFKFAKEKIKIYRNKRKNKKL